MDSLPLPAELTGDRNRRVLDYLGGASAHSDVAEALQVAVAPLGAASVYCPNPAEYRYIAVFSNQTVFAVACGMNTVAFRLSPDMAARALATGGVPMEAIGPDWVSFMLFRSDWPEVDMRFWARAAYVFAREGD